MDRSVTNAFASGQETASIPGRSTGDSATLSPNRRGLSLLRRSFVTQPRVASHRGYPGIELQMQASTLKGLCLWSVNESAPG